MVKGPFVFRRKISLTHLLAARKLSELCTKTEEEIKIQFNETLLENIKGYASGAIISSVSFLEALINELFEDAKDDALEDISPELCERLSEVYKLGFTEKLSILEKFQLALIILGKPLLIKGEKPYQDIFALISLRNELVHSRILWLTVGDTEEKGKYYKLEQLLKNKFIGNHIYSKSPFATFLEKALGAGCAKWAVETCSKFAEQYFEMIGINNWKSRFNDTMIIKTK